MLVTIETSNDLHLLLQEFALQIHEAVESYGHLFLRKILMVKLFFKSFDTPQITFWYLFFIENHSVQKRFSIKI